MECVVRNFPARPALVLHECSTPKETNFVCVKGKMRYDVNAEVRRRSLCGRARARSATSTSRSQGRGKIRMNGSDAEIMSIYAPLQGRRTWSPEHLCRGLEMLHSCLAGGDRSWRGSRGMMRSLAKGRSAELGEARPAGLQRRWNIISS